MDGKVVKQSARPTWRGALVVAGIFVFGGLIMGGLYLAPHGRSPEAPPGVAFGAPARKLRFVCYDLRRQHPENDPQLAQISKLNADYVLLQGVEEDEAVQIAEMLGMQQSFHPQLFQRSQNLGGRRVTYGNCVLSRQSLYEGAPLMGAKGPFGASAVSVVDGEKFVVCCAHFSCGSDGAAEAAALNKQWQSLGSPPLIVAVLPSDATLAAQGPVFSRSVARDGEWLAMTRDWSVVNSGSAPGAGAGSAPMWVDVHSHP